jgi:hypothetical protein
VVHGKNSEKGLVVHCYGHGGSGITLGTQFTCFTGTKVRTLTHEAPVAMGCAHDVVLNHVAPFVLPPGLAGAFAAAEGGGGGDHALGGGGHALGAEEQSAGDAGRDSRRARL